MRVTARSLERLKKIKTAFGRKAELPSPGEWRDYSSNDIWHTVVEQVMVVGRSEPAEKFRDSPDLKRRLGTKRLAGLGEAQVRKEINSVLREVSTRYASADPSKCRKTKALCNNFKVLSWTKGGPKGFVSRYLAPIEGKNADRRRIKYVMKVFSYFKSKSARDFLMTLGLVTDAIAIDVRLQNILRKVGIKVPEDVLKNARVYDKFEERLLTEVCKPLGMKGVHFDRMLYQNYDEIMDR